MDRRDETETNEYTYQKELEREKSDSKQYNEYVEENGERFYMPYHMVKEVLFADISKEDLGDSEHAARLQYRLMLQEAVLFAKVEFVARRIKITYNPESATDNRKAKTTMEKLIEFLADEGVRVNTKSVAERDVDYYNEIYRYHFNPQVIREHPPWGYTLDEWKGMKAGYEAKKATYEEQKLNNFHEFQNEYLGEHPELAEQIGVKHMPASGNKKGMLGLFGKKARKTKEKGFWFHGI